MLLCSGALKVAAGSWGQTAAAFGVPRMLRPVVPSSELLLGGALVAGLAAPWTAIVTIGVLVAFSAAVAVHLVRGHAVPCGCFGDLSARPVHPSDLLRNGSLVALAVVAAEPPRLLGEVAFGAAAFGAGAWLGLQVVASARHRPPPPGGRA